MWAYSKTTGGTNSVFIPPLSGSAGTWMLFNSRLIISDRMFKGKAGAGEDKAVAPGASTASELVPANSRFRPH